MLAGPAWKATATGGAAVDHPIRGLVESALGAIQQMVDVNTVVGEAVQTGDGGVIIPVSRVSFGFVAGGGEYGGRPSADGAPFGGGSGAGVSVRPVAFLVVHGQDVRLLPVEGNTALERLLDLTPELLEEVAGLWGRGAGMEQRVVWRRRPYAAQADEPSD
jgi:sporulation protein YtfJ